MIINNFFIFISEDYMSRTNNALSLKQPRNEEEYLSNSERYYKEEIYNLEKKLTEQPKCLGALCDWIASYHELALIYEQKGRMLMAQKCLLIPHQSMLYMALNHKGDKEWEQIALRALGITLPELIKFSEDHPTCKQCMKQLKSQLALIEGNNKTFH